MISMTAAICDDEKAFRYEISGLVCKYMKSRNIEIYTDSYANGTELLKSEKEYDVIFLDYQMEEINGIETAEKLRETNSDSVIIFISAYPAAALDAYIDVYCGVVNIECYCQTTFHRHISNDGETSRAPDQPL